MHHGTFEPMTEEVGMTQSIKLKMDIYPKYYLSHFLSDPHSGNISGTPMGSQRSISSIGLWCMEIYEQ
jgi:hypothetical protein